MSEIRLASASDAAEIEDLAKRAGLSVRAEEQRALPQTLFLVARDQAKHPTQAPLRGFILGWVVAGELEILDVAVAEECRGQGIGYELVQALLDGARARGAVDIFLEVRASNSPAARLYRKAGLEEVGRRARYYSDGEDALLFRGCLGSRP